LEWHKNIKKHDLGREGLAFLVRYSRPDDLQAQRKIKLLHDTVYKNSGIHPELQQGAFYYSWGFKPQPPQQGSHQKCAFGTLALKLTKYICAKYARLGEFKLMQVSDSCYSSRFLTRVD